MLGVQYAHLMTQKTNAIFIGERIYDKDWKRKNLEFMIKNIKNAWKEKKLGWTVNLWGLKMIDWIISVKNVKKSYTKTTNESIKNFPTFVMVISISFFCY